MMIMSNKKTGGPAFPPMHNPDTHESGMTLRDYFAAKAMQSMVRLHMLDKIEYHQRSVAEQAYRMADTMLEAREK